MGKRGWFDFRQNYHILSLGKMVRHCHRNTCIRVRVHVRVGTYIVRNNDNY